MAESDDGDEVGRRVPASILRAAAIVALEGAAVFALGPGLLIGGILMSRPDSLARAWAEVGFAVVAGVLILLLARGLSRAAVWSRGPVVVIQILSVPVGLSLAFGSQQPLYGIPLLVAAVGVLYLLFTEESRVLFEEADRQRRLR